MKAQKSGGCYVNQTISGKSNKYIALYYKMFQILLVDQESECTPLGWPSPLIQSIYHMYVQCVQ